MIHKDRVGFGFHPRSVELIYYLILKVLGFDFAVDDIIAEVNILEIEPEALPEFSATNSNGTDWYFLHKLVYKSSKLIKRTTRTGFWKITGKDKKVYRDGKKIGFKKILTFYKGRAPNRKKTDWVIHEYHLTNQGAYVICHLKNKAVKKGDNSTTPNESESSCQGAFDDGNISENYTSPEESLDDLLSYDSPSAPQSQIVMGQGQNLPFTNGFGYDSPSAPENQMVMEHGQNLPFTNGFGYDSPSALQYQMVMEQGQNLPFTNGCCESFNGMQHYVGSSEQVVDPFEETVSPNSLRMVSFEDGSDINAEPIHAQVLLSNQESLDDLLSYDSPSTPQSQIVMGQGQNLPFTNGFSYDSPSAPQNQMVMEQGQNLPFTNGFGYNSPSALQYQMVMEQGQNLPFTNGCCESFNGMQHYVGSSEQFVDPFEETVSPNSLRMVPFEDGSDTNAEPIHAQVLLSNQESLDDLLSYDSPSAPQSQIVMGQGQNLPFTNGFGYDSPSAPQYQMVMERGQNLPFTNGFGYDCPSALQYQMVMEQGQNLQFTNGFCESFNWMQHYVDSSEQVVDPFEETVPPNSLRWVYFEDGSDANAEPIHAQVKIYSPVSGEHISPIA